MKLNEALLLEGKSYKNYFNDKVKGKYATFFGYASELDRFKKLMKETDPTAKEDNVGDYADWLVRELKSMMRSTPMGRTKNSDLVYTYMNVLGHYLKYFHNNKGAFEDKDIYKHTLNDIRKAKDKVEDDKATRKMKGAKSDFDFHGWKIIEVKNHEMACNLGLGSKWCITMKEYPEQYYKYKKFGPIFFVVKGNRRWAITGSPKVPFMVWDEKDQAMYAKPWRKENSVPYEVYEFLIRRY